MTEVTANIFEQAARYKLRFPTDIGSLTVEQVWELPLEAKAGKLSLDLIAIDLHEQLEKVKTKSFVSGSKKDPITQLQFDIVKHIIDTRIAENKAKTESKKRESEIAKITDTLAKKKDEALDGLSVEALEARLLELKGGAAQ
jgi:hypothetical protein